MSLKNLFIELNNLKYFNSFSQSYTILKQFNPSIHDLYNINKYYYQYKKQIINKDILNISENNNYIKMQMFKNNYLDCYLIFWDPYSKSPIHNHSENGCYLKVLNGNLNELIYSNNNLNQLICNKTNVINNKEIGYIHNNMGYHSIINPNNFMVTSIHIYSPPNFISKIFSEN